MAHLLHLRSWHPITILLVTLSSLCLILFLGSALSDPHRGVVGVGPGAAFGGAGVGPTGSGGHSNHLNKRANTGEKCTCYIASGPSPGYFTNYIFYDFRNLTSNRPDSKNISSALSAPTFANAFSPQDWSTPSSPSDDAPVAVNNSLSNIFVSSPDPNTTLNLRTSRQPTYQSTAELELTQKNMLHASIRIRARIDPGSASGAVAGLFTYAEIYGPTEINFSHGNFESDIEILTSDPTNTIRYSNQPDTKIVTYQDGNTTVNGTDSIPGASTAATLPAGKTWDAFLTHRLDWFNGISRFWVDDTLLLNKTYGVPIVPMGLILNMWSNGGGWSQNMTIGDSATMSVEYIEMTFNTSGPITGEGTSKGKRARGLVEKLLRRSPAESEESRWQNETLLLARSRATSMG
jgi:hypothetical protein